MIRHAVDSWPIMREQPYLNLLPPTPTFRAFYTFRENIFSHLEAQERKAKKQQVSTPQVEKRAAGSAEPEDQRAGKRLPLREMVKQALKEQRAKKREEKRQ